MKDLYIYYLFNNIHQIYQQYHNTIIIIRIISIYNYSLRHCYILFEFA